MPSTYAAIEGRPAAATCGRQGTSAGRVRVIERTGTASANMSPTKRTGPSSTPALKNSSPSATCSRGRPVSLSAEAKPNPDVPREKQIAIKVEYLNKDQQLPVGENYKLRFKVIDTTTLKAKSDLKDVRVLTLLSSGTWQKRDFARSVGEGVYELDIKVPQSGLYLVFIESRSQGVTFRQLPYLTLQTTATANNTPAKEGKE